MPDPTASRNDRFVDDPVLVPAAAYPGVEFLIMRYDDLI
jgi:hypothetical protein